MHADTKPSFAFMVITYNHQEYILEHLESIKYLVQTHGSAWHVDLIVNDDASRDQTRTLVDRWLDLNATLFRHVKTLYNSKNLGTCASVNNMLEHMLSDRCKLTAGDDVYSFENIFELMVCESDVAMVSGRPLYLYGEELGVDLLSNTLATASQIIYQNNTLLHRFKHFSYNNAPNLMYKKECFLNQNVRSYLKYFDVIEDWALQIAISREYQNHKFLLIDRVFVYYRRTQGSTYIIENKRFTKDKIDLYKDLIRSDSSFIERLRLSSRKFCFESKNRLVNKLFNIDFYLFTFSCLTNALGIYKLSHKMDLNVEAHRKHYKMIRNRSKGQSTS